MISTGSLSLLLALSGLSVANIGLFEGDGTHSIFQLDRGCAVNVKLIKRFGNLGKRLVLSGESVTHSDKHDQTEANLGKIINVEGRQNILAVLSKGCKTSSHVVCRQQEPASNLRRAIVIRPFERVSNKRGHRLKDEKVTFCENVIRGSIPKIGDFGFASGGKIAVVHFQSAGSKGKLYFEPSSILSHKGLASVITCLAGNRHSVFGGYRSTLGEYSGCDGGDHRGCSQQQANATDDQLPQTPTGRVESGVGGFPLGAKIGLALIAAIGTTGVWARGACLFFDSRCDATQLLGRIAAGGLLLGGCFAAWSWASPY